MPTTDKPLFRTVHVNTSPTAVQLYDVRERVSLALRRTGCHDAVFTSISIATQEGDVQPGPGGLSMFTFVEAHPTALTPAPDPGVVPLPALPLRIPPGCFSRVSWKPVGDEDACALRLQELSLAYENAGMAPKIRKALLCYELSHNHALPVGFEIVRDVSHAIVPTAVHRADYYEWLGDTMFHIAALDSLVWDFHCMTVLASVDPMPRKTNEDPDSWLLVSLFIRYVGELDDSDLGVVDTVTRLITSLGYPELCIFTNDLTLILSMVRVLSNLIGVADMRDVDDIGRLLNSMGGGEQSAKGP